MDTKASHHFDERLLRFAARRHGVVRRSDIIRLGGSPTMIHDRVESGLLLRIFRGVYRINGTRETIKQRALAACLACGDGAATCRLSAAELWEFPGCKPCAVEIRTPRDRRARLPGIVTHRMDMASRDIVRLDGIPVTSPTRTLIDIAACVPPDVLVESLDHALREHLTTVARMQRRIAELPHRPGIGVIRALVGERAGVAVPENTFETRLLTVLLEEGLPMPVPQFRVFDEHGLIGRIDFAYPDALVAIEGFGFGSHSTAIDLERDIERRERLEALGWIVVVITWGQFRRDPRGCAQRVVRALSRRSVGDAAAHTGG